MIDWSKMKTAEDLAHEQAESQKAAARSDALAYLAKTDWLIARANDPSSGEPVPGDVIEKRAAARKVASA